MSDIDEVKTRTDLVQLAGNYVRLRPAGKALRAHCPFHQERTPSFYIWAEGQRWRCFGACATGGDVYDFLMQAEKLNFRDALRQLADAAGYTLKYSYDRSREDSATLYPVNQAAADYYHDRLVNGGEAAKARRYLESRGVTAADIAAFRLGYAGDQRNRLIAHLQRTGHSLELALKAGLAVKRPDDGHYQDFFHHRIIFPIQDAQGKTAGFAGRGNERQKQAKYINTHATAAFDKSALLYGLHQALPAIREQGQAVAVEGYLDVISAHRCGYRNVVATMGTAVTPRQAELLARYAKAIVVAPDGDQPGRTALLHSLEQTWGAFAAKGASRTSGPFAGGDPPEIRVATLPDGADPDSLLRENLEAWPELVDQAAPLYRYILDIISAEADPNDPQQRIHAANRFISVIANLPDPVSRDVYLKSLAERLDIATNAVTEQAQKMRRENARRSRPTPTDQGRTPAENNERFILRVMLQRGPPDGAELPPDHWFATDRHKNLYRCLVNGEEPVAELAELSSRLSREHTGLANPEDIAVAWRQTCRKLETDFHHQSLLEIASVIDADPENRAALEAKNHKLLADIRRLQPADTDPDEYRI